MRHSRPTRAPSCSRPARRRKAAVISGVKTVAAEALETRRISITENRGADFSEPGKELAAMVLADEVLAVLPRQRESHLVVVHDAPTSRIPWEVIAFPEENGTWLPAAVKGVSHRYAADNLSVAKWLEERLRDDTLSVLLVVNPTSDLRGAEAEGQTVKKLFQELPTGLRLDVLEPSAAERIQGAVSFAEAFLRGGIANFIGTYWPVRDAEAETFAKTFYTEILHGAPLGQALQNGRKVIQAMNSRDWANYILYGNPDFVLKEVTEG